MTKAVCVRMESFAPAHLKAIHRICAGVYGGTDYLPGRIAAYAADARKGVVCATDAADGSLLGVVVVERQLDSAFVMGLRVDPLRSGHGIGTQLMAAAEEHVRRHFQGVLTLQTATIQANLATQRILQKSSWSLQHRLDMWPRSEQVVQAAQRASHGAAQQSVVTFVDGAREALSTQEAADLVPRWQVCQSVEQLRAAVGSLHAQLSPIAAAPRSPAAELWVPFHYAPLPVDSAQVAHAIQAGRAYVLPAAAGGATLSGKCACGGACEGVLLLQENTDASAPDCSHQICGVLASCTAAVESALLLAERLAPHWVAFIARPRPQRPALFDSTPTHEEYCLVYMKDL